MTKDNLARLPFWGDENIPIYLAWQIQMKNQMGYF